MAWSNSVAITIDHTKVPNSDQTNFPLLFTGVYPQLATTAYGGAVTNQYGYDIIFASDSAGTSPLPFERVAYNFSTGTCEFWVQVPGLSHTTDTVLYILFGNSSVTTDQSAPTSVWDSNFWGVYHLAHLNGFEALDSTANANGGIAGNNGKPLPTFATSVPFGRGGASFAGFTNTAVYLPSVSLSPFTVSGWIKASSYACLLGAVSNGGILIVSSNGAQVQVFSGNGDWVLGTPQTLTNVFAHLAVTYDGSSTWNLYINGVLADSDDWPETISNSNYYIGLDRNGQYGSAQNGQIIDEVRISTSVRSPDWLATEYNNQNSPSTFYSTSLTTASPTNPWAPVPFAAMADQRAGVGPWPRLSSKIIAPEMASHQVVKGFAPIQNGPSAATVNTGYTG